ncbi:hypothetical protein ACFXJ8_12040 [Nonomuraea sp. NPDC059194]|uniref:hypothetical protein n=1 Tax=Nonomuraea sp. NPDC059194 TaxID=3346764 RepID=UPI00367881DD
MNSERRDELALFKDRARARLEYAVRMELTLKAISDVLEQERVFQIGLHAALDKVRALTAETLSKPVPWRER